MAEGWLRYLTNNKIQVHSAGIIPEGLNINAVKVMQEAGIDISMQTSNHIDEYTHSDFDYIITVCNNAREACPHFPAKIRNIHQNFPDPALVREEDNKIIEKYRETRDEIRDFCKKFISENIF